MTEKATLYPLTNTQKEALLDELYSNSPDRSLLTLIAFKAFIPENCNLQALEAAWNRLLCANDALRLRVKTRFGRPYRQYIAEYAPETLPVVHVDGPEGFEALQEELKGQPVRLHRDTPLYLVQLVDCGGGAGGMIVRLHHLCCDGYSVELMFRQLEKCYRALCEGTEPVLKAGSVTSFFNSQRAYRRSDDFKADVRWWSQLYRQQKNFTIPGGRPSVDGRVLKKAYSFTGARYLKLKAFCAQYHCTMSSAVMTAAALTTEKITGKRNFSIHMLTHGRSTFPLRQTVGCMVRTIPVFFRYDQEQGFAAHIARDCGNYLDAMRHCAVPFSVHFILSYWKAVRLGFNFFFNWLTISAMGLERAANQTGMGLGVLSKTLLSSPIYCAVYDLPEQETLTLDLIWQRKLFTQEQMDGFLSVFTQVLYDGLDDPEKRVSL